MSGHFILKCECGAIIAQCRCPDPSKQVRVSPVPCDDCLDIARAKREIMS